MTRSRLKRAGHVVEWEMKTWQAIRCSESGRKQESIDDDRDFDGRTAQIALGVGKCHMRVRNDGDCEGGGEDLRLHSQ